MHDDSDEGRLSQQSLLLSLLHNHCSNSEALHAAACHLLHERKLADAVCLAGGCALAFKGLTDSAVTGCSHHIAELVGSMMCCQHAPTPSLLNFRASHRAGEEAFQSQFLVPPQFPVEYGVTRTAALAATALHAHHEASSA